jgi:excisionase family DNA binding protein
MPSHKKQRDSLGKSDALGRVSAPVSIGRPIERHLRLTEAAALLGVSRPTMYRLLSRIRHCRVPCSGLSKFIILIPESALAAFLSQYQHIPGGDE